MNFVLELLLIPSAVMVLLILATSLLALMLL